MLLLSLIALIAGPAEPMPTKPVPLNPPYFADRLGESLQPVTEPVNLSDPAFLTVQTQDGSLRIAYRDVRSLSYSPSAISATDLGGKAFLRLLTIGFNCDDGIHHNLVVQLSPKETNVILNKLSSRTGLKVGDAPRN